MNIIENYRNFVNFNIIFFILNKAFAFIENNTNSPNLIMYINNFYADFYQLNLIIDVSLKIHLEPSTIKTAIISLLFTAF